ncbi:hypothetical protein CDAR_534661 [Caerostris darwini]|uniref:Uncharacterized protein n=1 Tax=Caerostris darwini TaxID=1538125 RepID=A0AAV4NRU5_9ARAC|nr:hypothetical protein CDAR_534661 [Caerostris darwini]
MCSHSLSWILYHLDIFYHLQCPSHTLSSAISSPSCNIWTAFMIYNVLPILYHLDIFYHLQCPSHSLSSAISSSSFIIWTAFIIYNVLPILYHLQYPRHPLSSGHLLSSTMSFPSFIIWTAFIIYNVLPILYHLDNLSPPIGGHFLSFAMSSFHHLGISKWNPPINHIRKEIPVVDFLFAQNLVLHHFCDKCATILFSHVATSQLKNVGALNSRLRTGRAFSILFGSHCKRGFLLGGELIAKDLISADRYIL